MIRPALARTAALIGAVCLLAAAALYFPRWSQGKPGRALRVVLLDASHSAAAAFAPGRWTALLSSELAREAAEARAAGEELCVVRFGRGATRIFGPAAAPAGARELPVLAPRDFDQPASELAAALELALQLGAEGRALHVCLHGDGGSTGGDPRPLLALLTEHGARIEWREPPAREVGELCLESIEVPRTARVGAPCAVRAHLAWLSAGLPLPASGLALETTLENAERNTTQRVSIEVPLALPARADGALAFDVRIELGALSAGENRVRVGDLAASVHASGVLTAGFVAADELAAAERARFQAQPSGLQIVTIAPDELALRIGTLDVLFTGDIALERLPGELIASFVEAGGGWLACLGSANLPRWGPITPVPALERCLPLAPRAHAAPPRERIVLLDVSGSMVGAPYAGVRAALAQMLEDASDDEHFELRLFARELSSPIALRGWRGANHTDGARQFEERVPREVSGGSTAVFAALQALARERAGRPALCVMLSDARDTSGADSKLELARTKAALAAAGIELAVLMPAGVGDRDVCLELCGPEHLFEAGWLGDPAGRERLAKLFIAALHPELVRSGPHIGFSPVPKTELSTFAWEIVDAQEERGASADWFPARTITSYVRAELATRAEALWRSDTGDPLVALNSTGRGHCGVLAFSPSRAPIELTPCLRAIARSVDDARPLLAREGDELVLRNAPAGLAPLIDARIAQRERDGRPRVLAHVALGPPSFARDPSTTRRGALAWAELASDGAWAEVEVTPELNLPLALPPAPEFVFPRPSLSRTERAHFDGRPPAEGERRGAHPAAEPLLIVGALLVAFGALAGAFARRAA